MGSSHKQNGQDRDSGNFTLRMIDYIKANFAEVLGPDVDLLDTPKGLEILRTKYFQRYKDSARKAA
jgi:hypothetical protein